MVTYMYVPSDRHTFKLSDIPCVCSRMATGIYMHIWLHLVLIESFASDVLSSQLLCVLQGPGSEVNYFYKTVVLITSCYCLN